MIRVKIVQLEVRNFMGVRAVDIHPDPAGNLVLVAGANGAGKSSILQSIWQAIGGGQAAREIAHPIRKGEDYAKVTLDLGDLRVTRTWKQRGDKATTALEVTSANGAMHRSPQALLDSLAGRISFDPVAFTLMSAKDQRAALLKLLDLPVDPDEVADRRLGLYSQRTDVNRAVKALKAQLDAIPEPPAGLPAAEQSSSEVLAELRAAQDAHADYAAKLEQHQRLGDEMSAALAEIDALRNTVARLGEARTALMRDLASTPEPADPKVIEHRLTGLESTNRAVRAAQERAALAYEHAAAQREADAITGQIDELDAEVAAAIAGAPKPVDGLGFDDDGVTYNGVPFGQCSAAERLRVSVAMAMAANPKLRVLRVKDGSLLDADSLALIERMAAEQDMQCWIEVVGDGGPASFVIEDGAVAVREAVPA